MADEKTPSDEALIEDADERRLFDQSVLVMGGSPLHAIANALAIWHKMAPEVGSYGKVLAIYSNEVHKAAVAAQRAQPEASDLECAAQAYGFVTMPDPATLFPQQTEMIERIAATIVQEREAIVQLIQEACGEDDSELADRAADAFNSGSAHRSVSTRIRDFCEVVIEAVRARGGENG